MGNCNSYNSSQTAWHCTATLCQALSTLLALVLLCKPSLTSCFCEYGTTFEFLQFIQGCRPEHCTAPVYQALRTLPALVSLCKPSLTSYVCEYSSTYG